MDDSKDKPNINRICVALQEGGLRGKYTEDTCGIDLFEAFFQFIVEEEFDDEQIPEEFGDGGEEESFFKDWLVENKHLSAATATEIWNDLNVAQAGDYDPIIPPDPITEEYIANIYCNYTISIRDADLEVIKKQLKTQCPDLMPGGKGGDAQLDKATFAIVQIGKQNRNQPLLIYLVDAYNRYRIQKRKQVTISLIKKGYNQKEFNTIFPQKFKDIEPLKFYQGKCTGVGKWLNEFPANQQKQFIEMCKAASSVFTRRLLPNPPMYPRMALVNDDILKIGEYIFQSYLFIEQFVQQKNAPLPAQIDVIIIPKDYKVIEWDEDEEEEENKDDEFDDSEEKAGGCMEIGDIVDRLKSMKNKCADDIVVGTANRTLLQSINSLFNNKRNQRGILIVDRRAKGTNKCYGFQPNKCADSFESNANKLIYESLMQNLRIITLPKKDDEKKDISVNTSKAVGLTFSFHCFSANEIRVYLCNNGWGTRFFIEDLKYFLPHFFVKPQKAKIQNVLKDQNSDFAKKYAKCREKCPDKKFEGFYKTLFDDDKHKCH